jgi:hypothetical protein
MATHAQIEANRRNAQKSTGPRTPDGKAAVRQNAFRHGLSAAYPLLTGEHYGQFERIHTALIEENQPIGINEEILVYKMAEQFFFQRRATWLLTGEITELQQGKPAPALGLMLRYHTAADRGFNRSLHDLIKLQKTRKLQEIGFVPQDVEEAPAETSVEPQTPDAAAPQLAPEAATQPVPAPFPVEPVEPAAASPSQTRKTIEKAVANQPHTPQKAA